jgi:hypothetical protein
MEFLYGPDFIPGAADAPSLDQILGPAPDRYAGSSRAAAITGVESAAGDVPTFRGGVESFDWIRLGWLALGIVVGLKILRN